MKKILVAVASKYIHSALAVWYLKAEMPEYEVFECTINEDIDKVFENICKEKPEILGFSCYIWNINFVRKLTKKLKNALPNVKIIYGGPEVSFNPQENLVYADCVVCGYGEVVLKEITEKLENDEEIEPIYYGKCGEIPKSPYCEEYFDALKGRIAYIETSRGCPFSCAFCLSGQGEKPLFFDLERAFEDIVKLSNSGAKTIKFVDRTFNAKLDRAAKLWEFLRDDPRLPKDICYHFEIGADLLTKEHLEILRSAPKGRFQMEVGLQSFNFDTLNAVNRTASVDKAVDNIVSVVDNSNMHVHTDLIIGLPYEGFESFKESFNKAYDLNAQMLQVGFLKLLHGSRLRNDASKYGIIFNEIPPYEVIETQWLNREEMSKLHKFEDIVERLHNSGRFLNTIEYLMGKNQATAFDFFYDISENINYDSRCSLEDFTAVIFEHFKQKGEKIRDYLVLDRMKTNNTGILPPCLKIYDEKLKKAKKYVNSVYPLEKGKLRSVALLYDSEKIAFADYDVKEKNSGNYDVKIINKPTL